MNVLKFKNKHPTHLQLKNHAKTGHLLGFAALLILLLVGCGNSEKQSDTGASIVSTIPLVTPLATLPPTWTPAPTNTPVPTATPTVTPTITVTPSATTTLTAEEICGRFSIVSVPDEGVSLPYAGVIAFSWDNSPPDSIVVLSLVRVKDGSEFLTQFPPEYQRNAFFELAYLPTWGAYRWTLSLFLESYGELCPVSGTFFREAWWGQPIINPLAPPFIFRLVE